MTSSIPLLAKNTKDICVFLDVDGTLLDIASRPQDVMVPRSLIRDLAFAEKTLGGALVLVSGRSIEVLDKLFRPLKLRAAGIHGAQTRMTENGLIETASDAALPVELRARLSTLAANLEGVIAEDKGASVALHYRLCPQVRDVMLVAINAEIERFRDASLTVLPGHFVFEIKRRGYDKGTALAAFMQSAPFKGRMPVVFGDDVTDEAAFRVAVRLGGKAFSVGRAVDGALDGFDEPEDVRRWIAEIAGMEERSGQKTKPAAAGLSGGRGVWSVFRGAED